MLQLERSMWGVRVIVFSSAKSPHRGLPALDRTGERLHEPYNQALTWYQKYTMKRSYYYTTVQKFVVSINAVLLNYFLIKESWKMHLGFH